MNGGWLSDGDDGYHWLRGADAASTYSRVGNRPSEIQ